MVDISNFNLPDGAHEAIAAQGRVIRHLDNGVDKMVSGHVKGVSFRFFVEQEINPLKSKILKYAKFEPIEMIEWHKDRFMKPTERLRFLPSELLELDEDGNTIGGSLKNEYDRWKQGLSAPGTPLAKWGVLGDSEVMTLAHMGIFSVEQFAAQPRSKIEGKLPKIFMDAFERAILEANGREDRAQTDKLINQVVELELKAAKKDEELEQIRQQLAAFMESKESKPKTKAKKQIVIEAEA